jgi:hypothetical protein
MAERALMEAGHFAQAKSYILYRDTRRKKRADRGAIMAHFQDFDDQASNVASSAPPVR